MIVCRRIGPGNRADRIGDVRQAVGVGIGVYRRCQAEEIEGLDVVLARQPYGQRVVHRLGDRDAEGRSRGTTGGHGGSESKVGHVPHDDLPRPLALEGINDVADIGCELNGCRTDRRRGIGTAGDRGHGGAGVVAAARHDIEGVLRRLGRAEADDELCRLREQARRGGAVV